MKLSVVLQESNQQIQKKIFDALKKEVNKTMKAAANKMIVPIRSKVRAALMSQPEIASLDSGKLRDEFGLPDGMARITKIIDYWVNNITVRQKGSTLSKGQINATFQIALIKSDFSDVIHQQAAILQTAKGESLPWLEWLLRFGDKAIIIGYEVSVKNNNRSRTGGALMIKNDRKNWRVPPEFSGTPQNNFVTRAIDSIQGDLDKIVEKTLNSVI